MYTALYIFPYHPECGSFTNCVDVYVYSVLFTVAVVLLNELLVHHSMNYVVSIERADSFHRFRKLGSNRYPAHISSHMCGRACNGR